MKVSLCTMLATVALASLVAICESRYEPSSLHRLRGELVRTERKLWDNVLDPRWNEVNDSDAQGPDVGIAVVFSDFAKMLDEFESMNGEPIEGSPMDSWWAWAKMTSARAGIDDIYESFEGFVNHQATASIQSPSTAWTSLAETILRGSDGSKSVPTSMDDMHQLVIHGNLFAQLVQESDGYMCILRQSPQQLLHNMYNTVLLTEIKGYAMMQFSWMLLKLYGRGNFTEEVKRARSRYEERVALTTAAAKSALTNANRAIWRCDPQQHVEGKTFVQVTRLLQAYIENEVNLNNEGTCRENCAYYKHTKNHQCYMEEFCTKQPACAGNVLRCTFVESDMKICQASIYSNRRYEWMQYDSGRTLGRKSTCQKGTNQVDSWWRWLFWHCSYCLCICDQGNRPGSDRFFSLSPVMANVRENKVVTGLRFIKVKRVIHLQINEGTLLPEGRIDSNSTRWRKVEETENYHQMSDGERGMDLDDLSAPFGSLVTGVRFKKIGGNLNFEILTTPFNYVTGELDTRKSIWISNDNTPSSNKPRKKLSLTKPDVPTKQSLPSTLNSKSDQYIEFDHTDLDRDFGQTTIPFIDIQPVIPASPVPLTGAGIYHKGLKGYGGYVAPKIFTYDFSLHLSDNYGDNIAPANQK